MPKFIKIEDRSIVKANELVEARYGLSVREQKFIEYAISLIEPNDEPTKRYVISMKDLHNLIGPPSKSGSFYTEYQEVLRKLKQKNLEIEQRKEKDWWCIGWIEGVHLMEGKVSFRFGLEIQPYLRSLKERFTQYYLKYVLPLNSAYSIRIYGFLKQYEKIGKRKIDLIRFKEMFNITEKYSDFYDIKRRILYVAQEELKAKTDISFEFEPIKSGRDVKGISFRMSKNIPLEILQIPESTEEPNLFSELDTKEPIIQELIEIGFDKNKAIDLIKNLSSILTSNTKNELNEKGISETDYLKEKIEYYKKLNKEKKVKNPTGFLIQSIKDNYKDTVTERKLKKMAESEANKKKTLRKEEIEEEKLKYSNEYAAAVEKLLIAKSIETKGLMEEIIQEYKKTSTFGSKLIKNSTNINDFGPMVKAGLCRIFEEKYTGKFFEITQLKEKYEPILEELKNKIVNR